MATRAEMEAELEVLRAKMAEIDAEVEEADAAAAEEDPVEVPAQGTGQDDEKGQLGLPTFDEAKTEIERVLASHGVSTDEIDALAQQLWDELDTLPQNKPLITAIGAFALGFLLGRMTK